MQSTIINWIESRDCNEKTVGILGLGVFGMTIAKQLSEYDCDIIAVDRDEVNVNRIEPLVTKAVIADVTDEDVLKEIGIGDCDTVVVAYRF